MAALPIVPEWEPVHGATFRRAPEPDRRSIELLAQELELQPLRWPGAWPPDTRRAMLTATYAKRVGRAVAFSLAAFRQAFAGGRDLGQESTVLIAAAACEMHPTAVLKGIGLRSVETALREAGNARAGRRRADPARGAGGRPRVRGSRRAAGRRRGARGGRAVRANRAFRLIVTREGLEPAFFADRDRLDRIEVVSIDDGEVVLVLGPAGQGGGQAAPVAEGRPGRASRGRVHRALGGRRRRRHGVRAT